MVWWATATDEHQLLEHTLSVSLVRVLQKATQFYDNLLVSSHTRALVCLFWGLGFFLLVARRGGVQPIAYMAHSGRVPARPPHGPMVTSTNKYGQLLSDRMCQRVYGQNYAHIHTHTHIVQSRERGRGVREEATKRRGLIRSAGHHHMRIKRSRWPHAKSTNGVCFSARPGSVRPLDPDPGPLWNWSRKH